MRWGAAICCLLWFVFARVAGANLEDELYHSAKRSKYLEHLSTDTLDIFVNNPIEPYMLVLFHIGTCHICKDALPSLEMIAQKWRKNELPIIVGHVDCTNNQEHWRQKYGFKGFPHLLLWHRPQENFAAHLRPLVEFASAPTSAVSVTKSEEHLLVAARQAKMGVEKDHLRLQGLGQAGKILKIELEDFTARLMVHTLQVSGKSAWFPLEALSYPDGSPLMTFERPDSTVHYRPASWKKEAMQDFGERMMRPTVTNLTSLAQLSKEMKDEPLVALVLCADEVSKFPGFAALAQTWKDKHRAYLASSSEACPVPGGPRPQLVVYSAPHHQWSPEGGAVAAAVVVGADIDDLSSWFDKHRFPGVWIVSYTNFHQIIHASRSTAVVAVNEGKQGDHILTRRKVEKIIKDVTRPAKAKEKGQPDVYVYDANSTFWGVVDGTLNGLDAFGILATQLPRVVIFEDDKFIEDVDELSIWNLKQGLDNLPNMMRYGSGAWGWMQTNIYKPWRQGDKLADFYGGMPLRVGFTAALVIGVLLFCMKLGQGLMSLLNTLGSDDDPGTQGHRKAE